MKNNNPGVMIDGKEQKKNNKRCWSPKCKKTSIIEDNGGWRWCWSHFWYQRDGYFSKMRRIIWSNLFN